MCAAKTMGGFIQISVTPFGASKYFFLKLDMHNLLFPLMFKF